MQQERNIEDILHWLRDYANHRLNSRLMDQRRTFPPYVILDLGNKGILGMLAPKTFGGMELNLSDTMRILEQFGAIDIALGLFVGLNNILGIMPIARYATSKTQEKILPMLATGRELAAFSITEPGAGSNPLAIQAQAIYDSNNKWKLFGTKIWSGSAAWAGSINIFVRLIDENNRDKGITGFIIKQGTKGLRQGAEELTMGMRGMIQNTIHLEGVSATTDFLLGKEGRGMDVAQDAMMHGRLGIGALCLGGVKRCLQLILRYAEKRSIATGNLLDNNVTLLYISDIIYSINTLENIIKIITARLDANENVPKELFAICKILGSEFLWEAADKLVQLLGGRGYIETNIAPQILRDARIFRIFEGPTETLYAFLGSKMLSSSHDMYNFLQNNLKMPQAVDRIKNCLEMLQNDQSNNSSYTQNYQYNTFVIGKIITYLIPIFILQHNFKNKFDDSVHKTIAWLEASIKEITFKYISQKNNYDFVTKNNVKDLINCYRISIGDIEQTMAGENLQLDGMLSR